MCSYANTLSHSLSKRLSFLGQENTEDAHPRTRMVSLLFLCPVLSRNTVPVQMAQEEINA